MALDAINKVVEEVGVDRFPGLFAITESEDKINIGSKPLRLLNIVAQDDVTLSQAAEMLDISVDTANKQIAKIKSELGVSTLPSAVFYAANKGLIDKIL
jgi:DNA-binding CsgD family transcriptional regulator